METEKKTVEEAPAKKDSLEEAIENDDNLANVFASLEEQPTEEDVGETEEAKTEDGEVANDGTEQQVTTETVSDDKQVKFKQFYKEDGTLDTDKLLKSYENAQQLIGKTASMRGELNRAKEVQAQFEQFRGLVESDKELAGAVGRAIQRKQGVTTPAETQEVTAADLNKQVEEAYAKGDFAGAHRLLNQHDPNLKALEERAVRAERALAEQHAREQSRTQDGELRDFTSRHVQDGLFDEHGQVKDVELFDAMKDIYGSGAAYASLPYEDVFHIARSRLLRQTTPTTKVQVQTKPNTDKARAIAASRVQSRAVSREPANNQEAIPGFGVSFNDLEAYFKGSK